MSATTKVRPITRSATATARDPEAARPPFLVDLYSTALGKKYAMAISGVALIVFVLFHMAGNLKMYLGLVEENGVLVYDVDVYAEGLRDFLVPILPRLWFLWILRIGLIVAFVVHIHAAYSLTLLNRRARPVKYQTERDYQATSFASRTMRWTGTIVLLYLVWHLADLTFGWTNPGFEHGDVYSNVDASLSRVPVAILYIVANITLGIHLFHGAWSLFQTMGLNNTRFNRWRRWLATGIATAVVVGNVSFPIMTLAGVIDHDPSVPSLGDVHEPAATEPLSD